MTDDRTEIRFDPELCIGVGNCELLAPSQFRVDEDTAVAQVIGDGRLPRPEAEAVVDRCPSGALSLGDG